ncbi:hypothetical protein [Desertivirga brevis]|uniref:hypothetical protein n=1 Tax=Desertivirga brevis TaxID=2810310 RepID=UPI001A967255|nr:hypothetical protein [Pedobacter sp. SYSU D00873]
MRLAFIAIAALCSISCKPSIENQLQGKWDFYKVESRAEREFENSDHLSIKVFDGVSSRIFASNYMYFEDEKKCTGILGAETGNYFSGNWHIEPKDSTLYLTIEGKDVAFFKIENIVDDKLYCTFKKAQKKYSLISLDQILVFKRSQEGNEDEMSYTKPQFNQWRIKPKTSENFNQIKERVKGALRYSALVCKLGMKYKSRSVSTATFNLPLKYYSNGVMMKPLGECKDWTALFYDEYDALVGYNIVVKAIKSDLIVPRLDSPMETNEFIFTELLKTMN